MTYFETPNQYQAFLCGQSAEDFERAQDIEVQEMEILHEQNRPDLPVEDRPAVSESDIHPSERY